MSEFTTLPLVTQIAVVAFALFALGVIGLIVWAKFWRLSDERQCECCAEETHIPNGEAE